MYINIGRRYSVDFVTIHIIIIGVETAKRDLANIFSSFQIISYLKRHLCPLHFLSYALEISLSIMELQEI